MSTATSIASAALVLVGLAFVAISAVGLLRLPEIYTRAHAVAKSETLGLLLIFAGLFLRPELDLAGGVRLALILAFSIVANPTSVHALVRAARRAGVEPWQPEPDTAATPEGTDAAGGAGP